MNSRFHPSPSSLSPRRAGEASGTPPGGRPKLGEPRGPPTVAGSQGHGRGAAGGPRRRDGAGFLEAAGWRVAAGGQSPRGGGEAPPLPPRGAGRPTGGSAVTCAGLDLVGFKQEAEEAELGRSAWFFPKGIEHLLAGSLLPALVATLSREQSSSGVPKAAQKATREMGQVLETRTCGVAMQSYVCLCFLHH